MTSKPSTQTMEPSKTDLIRTLCALEGELQAKDIVISILKTEQVRRLVHPCYNKRRVNLSYSKLSTDTIIPNNRALKCKQQQDSQQQPQQQSQLTTLRSNQLNINASDPYIALLRDTYCAFDPTFDENSTKLIYNLQYQHLKALIEQQRRIRRYLESQIADWEFKYKSCFQELENERLKSEKYERDKMIKRIDELEKENNSLSKDLGSIKNDLEKEKEREKSMVMCLITERKELICRLIEENQRNSELVTMLEAEKSRTTEMVEGLEEESKRSLQMESELERLSANYEKTKQTLLDKLNTLETKNVKLEEENDKLKKELEAIKSKRIAQLGEGARSTVVTVNSSDHKIVPSVTSIVALNQPKLNVARPVSPNRSALSNVASGPTVTNPRSGGVTVGQASSGAAPPSTYATIQPVSKSGANHALSAVNPITPAPPVGPPPPLPKGSTATSQQTTNAFQNMTYSMESPPVASKTPISVTSQQPVNASTPLLRTTTTMNVTPGKVMVASGSPQQPVQKKLSTGPLPATAPGTSPVYRGAPPPIPPNKPILPANALKERSKEIQQATVRAKMMTVKPINMTPPTSTAVVPVQGEQIIQSGSSSSLSPLVVVANGTKHLEKSSLQSNDSIKEDKKKFTENSSFLTDTIRRRPQEPLDNVEMISQEIADFQQLLGSMVEKSISDCENKK